MFCGMSPLPLDLAIERIGLQPLSRGLGVTYQTVRKWQRKGLPRTEWTGETQYAARIEKMMGGEVTAEQIKARHHPALVSANSAEERAA